MHTGLSLGFGHAERHSKEQIFGNAHVRKQQRILEHQTNAALVGGPLRHITRAKLHTPDKLQWQQALRHLAQSARDGGQHRALATAASAHEGHDLACRHRQTQALHQRLVGGAQAFDVQLQGAVHGRSF